MKKKLFLVWTIALLLGLMPISGLAQAPVNCDQDANGALDVACGGTNATTAPQALQNLGAAATPPASVNGLATNSSGQFVAETAHNDSAIAACVTTNSGNAYTCTTTPTFTPAAGDQVLVEFNAANTGTSTLAVNGATAATIVKWGGSGTLIAGDLLANHWIRATFDGTYWQLEGQLGNANATQIKGVAAPTIAGATGALYDTNGVLSLQTGLLNGVRVFTSGSSATYTPTSGTTHIVVELIGQGGGGGGCTGTSSDVAVGGGGGSGGSAVWFHALTAATGTYTVGTSGGTGGTTSGGTGTAGTATTFAYDGTTVTANGGSGGVGETAGTSAAFVAGGAAAAVSTNGTINGSGQPGAYAWRASGTVGASGAGASIAYGGGGVGLTSAGVGNAGVGYGSGGGGCMTTNSTAEAGGAGAGGLIVVWEYL